MRCPGWSALLFMSKSGRHLSLSADCLKELWLSTVTPGFTLFGDIMGSKNEATVAASRSIDGHEQNLPHILQFRAS